MANLNLKHAVYSKKFGVKYKVIIVLKEATLEECILYAKNVYNVNMDGSEEVSFNSVNPNGTSTFGSFKLKITGK